MAVLAHMNQPLGSCLSYTAELASLASASASQAIVENEAQGLNTSNQGNLVLFLEGNYPEWPF
jgi:hypothetical protein